LQQAEPQSAVSDGVQVVAASAMLKTECLTEDQWMLIFISQLTDLTCAWGEKKTRVVIKSVKKKS